MASSGAGRAAPAAGADRARVLGGQAPRGENHFASSPAGRPGQPHLHLSRRGHLPRLPGRTVRSRRPPLSLSVSQLHQLRPAADDHHRRPLRPAADDHGLVRDVRRVPAPSTTIPPTAASTPSPPPARPAARGSRLLDAVRATTFRRRSARPLAAALRGGKIGAIKGLGGYHLACVARDPAAVAELRRRKHRDEKPFAVMVRGHGAAAATLRGRPASEALLLSPRRPIVLLRKRRPRPRRRGGGARQSLSRRDAALHAAPPPAAAGREAASRWS